jgi:hypothetical protein
MNKHIQHGFHSLNFTNKNWHENTKAEKKYICNHFIDKLTIEIFG